MIHLPSCLHPQQQSDRRARRAKLRENPSAPSFISSTYNLCPLTDTEVSAPPASSKVVGGPPCTHPFAMASLARRHPKTAILAAAAFVCLPIWLPLLLITSPFLLVTSLFSMGVMTLLKFLFRLSLCVQRSLAGVSSRRRLGVHYAGMQPGHLSFEDVHRGDEGRVRENRIHEYLEDQLKNLTVVAFGRTESADDLLPCSFSFGGADGHREILNYGLLSHDEV